MNKERLSRRKPPQAPTKKRLDTNLLREREFNARTVIASLLRSMFPNCEEELFVKIFDACVEKHVN